MPKCAYALGQCGWSYIEQFARSLVAQAQTRPVCTIHLSDSHQAPVPEPGSTTCHEIVVEHPGAISEHHRIDLDHLRARENGPLDGAYRILWLMRRSPVRLYFDACATQAPVLPDVAANREIQVSIKQCLLKVDNTVMDESVPGKPVDSSCFLHWG